MGKREREDSRRVMDGKPILKIKRWRLLDLILYPYRAWKEKKRQEELKRRMFESMVDAPENFTDNEDVH